MKSYVCNVPLGSTATDLWALHPHDILK